MPAKTFKLRPVPAIVTALMVVVMLALGFWQLERLQAKTELLARLDSRMSAAAAPLPEQIDLNDWEYRHVTLAGQYLYEQEFKVGPRVQDGAQGYHLLTPFRRVSGGTILINRGFVPDARSTALERPQGIVQVEGYVQKPGKGSFTPANNAAKNQWYWIDTAAMLPGAPDYIVTAVASNPGVYPAGGALRVDIPNDHKHYAIFWFGMAFVMLVIFVLASRQPAVKLEQQNAGV
ncbi:MAG TPA: SURF1 family protein [Patescibacteria group bacterium]|nr:SURF1 family protein [Patescibacteria group bacterium]